MKIENEHLLSESFRYLDICCRLIEKKYDKGPIRSWTNGDYIKLSACILRETGILVSANTLKRIFGKIRTSSRYYPQKATRDALASYAGFTDWEILAARHETTSGREKQPESATNNPFSSKRKPILTGAFLLTLLLSFTIWLWRQEATSSIDLKKIRLICKNPVGGNPHSAIFNLVTPPDFSEPSASFTLAFGDGKYENLDVNHDLITHYYEIPGRYFATLKYNNTILDTVPVYLKTESWTATGTMMHDTTRVYPVLNVPLFRNGSMSLGSKDLYHAGIDTNQTFFVHYVLSKPLGISGDNFLMTADVKASPPRPGVRCSQLVVTIYGEKTDHNFFIIKPGCVTWSRLRFSEIVKDGKYSDLSFLGADLTGGGTFRLEVIDQSVSLWINNSMVHKTSYQLPLKEIRGIKFSFAGIGYVDRVSLKDLSTGKVYANNFSE